MWHTMKCPANDWQSWQTVQDQTTAWNRRQMFFTKWLIKRARLSDFWRNIITILYFLLHLYNARLFLCAKPLCLVVSLIHELWAWATPPWTMCTTRTSYLNSKIPTWGPIKKAWSDYRSPFDFVTSFTFFSKLPGWHLSEHWSIPQIGLLIDVLSSYLLYEVVVWDVFISFKGWNRHRELAPCCFVLCLGSVNCIPDFHFIFI